MSATDSKAQARPVIVPVDPSNKLILAMVVAIVSIPWAIGTFIVNAVIADAIWHGFLEGMFAALGWLG